MDHRMQEYWTQKRDTLINDIQSLEKETAKNAVSEQEWGRIDKRASVLLAKLKDQAIRSVTKQSWGMWKQFGKHTITTTLALRREIRKNVRARIMLCVGNSSKAEYPFTVYEVGLQSKNEPRTLWVSGLDPDRLSDSSPFLWVDFSSSKTVMCRIYPETDTTPASLIINKDLGVNLDKNIPLNGMVPIAFRNQMQTVQPIFQCFVDIVQRDNRHQKMRFKLKCLQEELQTFDRTIKKWDKVCLPPEQKIELIKQMDMFMAGSNARPRALLLKGGPGTGKTLLAQTMAEIAGSQFYKLSISDIKHPHLGESAQRVAKIWKEAQENKPALIFIDECESLFGKRGASETDVISTDIVQAFLSKWDGKENGIWVIAATNRRDMIDDAILSRFGSEMEIALPDEESRRLILQQELMQIGSVVRVVTEVARQTQGFSGRDLVMLAGRMVSDVHPGSPTVESMLESVRKQRVNGNIGVDTDATWTSLVLAPTTMSSIQTVCSILKDAEGWKSNGITIPTGILLTGPPGTGKTQIARTMANESGLRFISATTAQIKAGYIGQSGQKVKQLFERARSSSPAILFIDEIDIISTDRGSGGASDDFKEEIIGQLLQEIDGVQESKVEVFVLAATNCPGNVDKAILSRFTQQIVIPLPDFDGRQRILEVLLRAKTVDFNLLSTCNFLAGKSEGFSGRDLKNWIARAEQKAVCRAIHAGGPKHFMLTINDFLTDPDS